MISQTRQDGPASRINITLDLQHKGRKTALELPLKLLVLADFSNRSETISQRCCHRVNKQNINDIMATIKPSLNLQVTNKLNADELPLSIKLDFNKLNDFTPDNLAERVPELKKRLQMRDMLKNLKKRIADNKDFRQQLSAVCGSKEKRQLLQMELQQLSASKKH